MKFREGMRQGLGEMEGEMIQEMIENKDYEGEEFAKSLYWICLYMTLHEPEITLEPTDPSCLEFRYFKKDQLYCIDGFSKPG